MQNYFIFVRKAKEKEAKIALLIFFVEESLAVSKNFFIFAY